MTPSAGRRVLVLGATGTIGRATVAALAARGHAVTALVRPRAASLPALADLAPPNPEQIVTLRPADVTDPVSLARDGIRGERFDALVSCLASRTGAPADAWAIDHRAHLHALAAARDAGVTHMVLLSAICVQKPRLAFQHAKLAFEAALIASGLAYSIVRPTAYFKSLSGQIARVKRGKPFLVFGDGRLTSCKPISDGDLGRYLSDCLDDPARRNRILPIGGPGDAITPLDQGALLHKLVGRPPRFKHVPVALLDGIAGTLGALDRAGLGRALPALARKAEFARIGRYYATESMLVLDRSTGRYDAALTPSFGTETLADHYARVLRGEAAAGLGEHGVF